ncbi:MAG: phosphatase PAP2 family protein [Lactobacillaceae bacterium]|jgi:membrane-associated phospholipid phosphatase|nr:phosphatase PAP2 family protein [Lactobacillaceae bacterium]
MARDYAAFYRHLSAPFRQHPHLVTALRIANRVVEVIMYGAYLFMLAWLIWCGFQQGWPAIWPQLWRLVLIPGVGFVLLSLVRQRLNAPRPYEQWPIDPLIAREKTGDSFPSRHVFSATVIAMVSLWLDWHWGLPLLVLALLLAAIRVVGGVHYPRDVVAGAVCGLVVGSLLFL